MRYIFCIGLILALLVGGFAVLPIAAQDAQPDAVEAPAAQGDASGVELAAIRAEAQAFVDAFNNADATAISELWTEDGDYIDESGRIFMGREAIQAEYENFFAVNPGNKIRVIVDSMRLLSDSTAIEDGRAMIDPVPAGAPGYTKYMAVHVKVDGKWKMSTVRDTYITTSTSYGNVADLEWLIGTWTAEEHGAKFESVCRWVANKHFVERTYKVTNPYLTTTSGVQIIGYNPQGDHVQSWNFSSDGGHAIGVWTPGANGWVAQLDGLLGDGTATTATVVLTKLDENAYTWQSIDRMADGFGLPDTEEIVLKRSTTTP